MNKLKIALVALVLLVTAFLIYLPHLNNPYPMHGDEWKHISATKALMEGNYEFGKETEIGFHAFLAGLSYLGFNLVTHYQYLAAIVAMITSLMIFLIVNRFMNFWTAIFSMIMFAFLRFDTNIIGSQFFIPLTLALPLALLFFYLFLESKFFLSTLVLLFIVPIHATTALFSFTVVFVYSIITKKIKNVFPYIGVMVFSFIASLFLLKGTFISKFNFLSTAIIFRQGWTPFETSFGNPIFIYGIVPFILALIGAIYYRQNRFFIVWGVTSVILILIPMIFKFSVIVPYQRMVFFLMISLLPLSGFGLYKIVSLKIRKEESRCSA